MKPIIIKMTRNLILVLSLFVVAMLQINCQNSITNPVENNESDSRIGHNNTVDHSQRLKFVKAKGTGNKYYKINEVYIDVYNPGFEQCFCVTDPLTAVPCDLMEEYCFNEADPFDPFDPWWETEDGRIALNNINRSLSYMGMRLNIH